MKFKDLPIKDKDILEGREPLPEEANYLMDKYAGTGRIRKIKKNELGQDLYFNPDFLKKGQEKTALTEDYSVDLYAPMNQSELEDRKWGRTLTDVFDIDPNTMKMTPKEGISEENADRYFEIIKRNLKNYGPTDIPMINRMRGAISDNQEKDLSSISLQYDPSTGSLIKKSFVTPENRSLRDVLKKDEAVAEFQQLSPYYKLLQSVKEKYKNIQDPEERAKLESAVLSEEINKNPQSRQQMEELKKNQQRVLDLYKEHAKKFGERV